jgi:signal transduction histidine kinase
VQGVAYIDDVGKLHPGPLLGDRGRLRQVIANGISNAAKFTDAGSVTFRVWQTEETPIAVRLQFTVLDSGCGIPAGVLPTLFQPFRQADSSTARRHGGTGLGPTISWELMTLMGGTVGLSSEEGKGTAMAVTPLLHKDLI